MRVSTGLMSKWIFKLLGMLDWQDKHSVTYPTLFFFDVSRFLDKCLFFLTEFRWMNKKKEVQPHHRGAGQYSSPAVDECYSAWYGWSHFWRTWSEFLGCVDGNQSHLTWKTRLVGTVNVVEIPHDLPVFFLQPGWFVWDFWAINSRSWILHDFLHCLLQNKKGNL